MRDSSSSSRDLSLTCEVTLDRLLSPSGIFFSLVNQKTGLRMPRPRLVLNVSLTGSGHRGEPRPSSSDTWALLPSPWRVQRELPGAFRDCVSAIPHTPFNICTTCLHPTPHPLSVSEKERIFRAPNSVLTPASLSSHCPDSLQLPENVAHIL